MGPIFRHVCSSSSINSHNQGTPSFEVVFLNVVYIDFYARHPIQEGLDGGGGGGGVWNSLISKNLAHYSLSLKFLLIL